ncbi:hypothetical protein ACLB2K_043774 [Fragaria x ananassa]
MAKLISTAAALFLLFAFSHARTPSDLPNGLDVIADNKIPVTDADVKATTTTDNTLRLPSERPGSETVVESEPATFAEEQKLPEGAEFVTIVSNEENTADASKSETTLPLTVISFRPVGRHFSRRPFPLGFRHGHRCRHGHRQAKWTPRVKDLHNKDATPYGDDMILASGEPEMKFDRPFRGEARPQIPARWTDFRHVGPRFPHKHGDEMDSERPHLHHRRHRHHDHDDEMENEGEEHHREHRHEHRHEQHHGLFRSFRKFLNGF